MRMCRFVCSSIAIVLAFTASLSADRVRLRSGQAVTGSFMSADVKIVRVLLENGKIAELPVEDISAIEFTPRKAPPPPAPDPAKTPPPITVPMGTVLNVRLTQAIDVAAHKVRWRKQWPTPLVAGVTVTSGNVLFTGDFNNDFLVIDTRDGKTLYRFNTGGSVGGGVISYQVDGKQYVATTSGVVSGFFGGSGTSAVIVFALP